MCTDKNVMIDRFQQIWQIATDLTDFATVYISGDWFFYATFFTNIPHFRLGDAVIMKMPTKLLTQNQLRWRQAINVYQKESPNVTTSADRAEKNKVYCKNWQKKQKLNKQWVYLSLQKYLVTMSFFILYHYQINLNSFNK